MKTLGQMVCTACRADEPTLDETEIAGLMPQTPGWRVVEREGIKRLERVFEFADFAQALVFTNKVGALAESAGLSGHIPKGNRGMIEAVTASSGSRGAAAQ